jgi:uncharacterized membrane protein
MAFLGTPLVLLCLLIGPWAVTRLTKGAGPHANAGGRWGIAAVFAFTGLGHFLKTEGMMALLPEWVPLRYEVILFTGVLEIALGFAILVGRTRRPVAWLLLAMLVAFLPVNIWAAIHRVEFGGHELGPIYLFVRVPLQLLFVFWVIRFGEILKRDSSRENTRSERV